jgi:hypothetical protein
VRQRLLTFKHKIAHLIGIQAAIPESHFIGDHLYMGYRCITCKEWKPAFEWMDEEEYHTGI